MAADQFALSPGDPKPRNEDEQRCLSCSYHGNIRGYVACLYLQRTGKRRGCNPGIMCLRYQPYSAPRGGMIRGVANQMFPLDREVWAELLNGTTMGRLARELGVCDGTLRTMDSRGTISLQLAEIINGKYHVKLIKTD